MTEQTIKAALLGTRGVPAKYGAFEYAADRIATLGGQGRVKWTISCPAEEGLPETYGNANLIGVQHGKGSAATVIYDFLCLLRCVKGDYDVVFMLGYGLGPGLMISRFGKTFTYTNTNGFEYKRAKWAWWVKLYFRFAEACAANLSNGLISDSVHVASYYKEKYGKESNFIAYGTDVPGDEGLKVAEEEFEEFLKEHNLVSRQYHVVVMRLEPENSIESIVDCFLNDRCNLPVVIVGPSTDFFEKVSKRIPAGSNKVKVIGAVYNRELLFLIRKNAFSYVHGHTVGGINPTILEALSTGTPVIARDTLFNTEVLEESGHYFNSTEELISCVTKLEGMSDTEWVECADRVAGKLKDCFTWERVVEQYEELAIAAFDKR